MRDFERQESMYMHQGKTVFSLRINYSPHVEIPRYLEIPVTDFCETSQIRPIIRLRALVTSFSRDIHSHCESYNIIILFTLCVILVL